MILHNQDGVIRELDLVTLNNGIYDLEVPEIIKEAFDMNPVVKYINEKIDPYKAKILLGHVNARSLPNSIDEIRFILSRTSFDIFEVSETWLSPGTPKDRVNIDGYKILGMTEHTKDVVGLHFMLKTTIRLGL